MNFLAVRRQKSDVRAEWLGFVGSWNRGTVELYNRLARRSAEPASLGVLRLLVDVTTMAMKQQCPAGGAPAGH